jgi:selenocysteine lyase/cysteine desulfurase
LTPLVAPDDFPASRQSTYLNTASVSLMYAGAERAVVEWTRDLASHGTIHFDEAAEEGVFARLHAAAAQMLNCRADDIAVGSSATELLSSLAWAVARGPESNVVSTALAFPSTVYPWARVARSTGCEMRLARGRDDRVGIDDLARLIDRKTAVVCLSDVEYSTGQRHDVARVAEIAHAHDALLVVDATQSAGSFPIDVGAWGVDALVCASYKWLCGPFGVAVMYLAPHLQHDLDPGLVGFRSHREMWDLRADRLDLPETARRFEFSTMAYGCALGLAESIGYLMRIGLDRVAAWNRRLADLLIEGLRTCGGTIVPPLNDRERTSIVAVRFADAGAAVLAEHLNRARIVVSARGEVLRFSPHLYNDEADVARALEEIDRILARPSTL